MNFIASPVSNPHRSRHWRDTAGAVLTALMILPLPAYATFTNLQWASSPSVSGPYNPFSSFITSGNGTGTGTLNLNLASYPSTSYTSTETWSITATLTTTDGKVSGSWANLSDFSSIQPNGRINVKVVATNASTTSNMFGTGGTDYNFNNAAPSSANLTQATGLNNSATTTVTITFTIDAFTVYTPSTPAAITLTLN
jgi:hypothetical protein